MSAQNEFAAARLSIAEAGNILNVSLDTIRRWEKKGLVKAHRDKNKHRFFNFEELKRLKTKLSGENNIGFKILTSEQKTPFKVVELFAGAGGLALGLHNAGLGCEMLVEIDKNAATTLKINKPDWNVINSDIGNIDFSLVKAEVLSGGFPCQAFSYAGKRLGFEDTRGTLFFEYARAVKQIKPQIILAENVKGLEKHDNGRTLSTMLEILSELGYRLAYRILRAQYLDVAQKRERLVIIGVRNDLQTHIAFPREQDYTISIREALHNVPVSNGQNYTDRKKQIMQLVSEGGYWRDLPEEVRKKYMGASYYLSGGKTGMARRLSWDEPSLTLTCNPAQKQTERCHPAETRPLTIREYARIQSFPDSWQFHGSVGCQYKQIGNAVPVNLGYHIGRCIIAMLNNSFDEHNMVILSER
ncbi:DNA (cytosine-5-)-methyltransferase [Candidatus Trichorickettsia mobilis]|uniref:DNA (cytosine-5-)-methyltransferase n=1 Tax=Candidatus Trichorickettsia mobilis TaxID=1346319 RepID=UPI00292FA61B|nr:DNA (cytosine-5-)-methyltransferase [Candidatus Trichorickettsia mobilis]